MIWVWLKCGSDGEIDGAVTGECLGSDETGTVNKTVFSKWQCRGLTLSPLLPLGRVSLDRIVHRPVEFFGGTLASGDLGAEDSGEILAPGDGTISGPQINQRGSTIATAPPTPRRPTRLPVTSQKIRIWTLEVREPVLVLGD